MAVSRWRFSLWPPPPSLPAPAGFALAASPPYCTLLTRGFHSHKKQCSSLDKGSNASSPLYRCGHLAHGRFGVTGREFYSVPASWCVMGCPFTASWNRRCLMRGAPYTVNCMGGERLQGGGWGGGGCRGTAPGAEQWLPNYVTSCQPHERCTASLPHEVPQKGPFIFSQWLFSTVLLWGLLGGIPCSPPVNNGAQSPGRRNLTMYPGAIFDYSEWLWLRVCPRLWRLPPSPPSPPPLEMSRQPVLCTFPWLAFAAAAAVHWYVHSSRLVGLTGFLPYMAIRALGLSAGQDNFLPLLWLAAWWLREWWDLGAFGEGKPLSQVQRTFNSLLVFWSSSLCWAHRQVLLPKALTV